MSDKQLILFFPKLTTNSFETVSLKTTSYSKTWSNATFDIYFGFSIGAISLFFQLCALTHHLNYYTFIVSYNFWKVSPYLEVGQVGESQLADYATYKVAVAHSMQTKGELLCVRYEK